MINIISSLSGDLTGMTSRCSELAVQLTAMESERDELRIELAAARRLQLQYETENLRLRELHATAVFAVQELTAALRDMTARALGEELNRR